MASDVGASIGASAAAGAPAAGASNPDAAQPAKPASRDGLDLPSSADDYGGNGGGRRGRRRGGRARGGAFDEPDYDAGRTAGAFD